MFPKPVHSAVNICLKLRRVQHIILMGPPCRIKLSAISKVTAQVSNAASCLVLFLALLKIQVVQAGIVDGKKLNDLFLADRIFLLKFCQRVAAGVFGFDAAFL